MCGFDPKASSGKSNSSVGSFMLECLSGPIGGAAGGWGLGASGDLQVEFFIERDDFALRCAHEQLAGHSDEDPPTSAEADRRYEDVEASRAHAESEYMQKLRAALTNDLLDGPPEAQELVFIRSK